MMIPCRRVALLRGAVSLAAAALLTRGAGAQGTVSAQGFGYPPGQLSTRALTTGGSLGEVDPESPLDPAALALSPAAEVYAQYDPELRTATGPSGTSSTTTARFPNLGALLPLTSRFVVGLGASTLLDRTWATTSTRRQVLGSDTVSVAEGLRSEGGITDVRMGAAYAVSPSLRIGVAGHFYTGADRITASDAFGDTLRYRGVSQVSHLSFAGSALSVGAVISPLPRLSIALDARKGRSLRMYAGDTLLTQGSVPDRYGASVSVEALPGTLLSVRAARERWSSFNGLSAAAAGASAVDANDLGAGLESRGPRIAGSPILVRLGVRRRTLPFAVAGSAVTETSFGGGLGIPVAYEHVVIDLGAMRDQRTGVAGISERALTVSVGLRVRP